MTRVADADEDTGGFAADGDVRLLAISAAVVTVCAPRRGRSLAAPHRSPFTAMEQYADLIGNHTPIRVLRLPITTGDVQLVAARISSTAPRVSVAFVTGVGSGESCRIKQDVAARGGPLILTELDAITAVLAATTISVLRRGGAAPRSGKVVVNSPELAPLIGPTLMKCGVREVVNWNSRDAYAFPLRRLMERHDVLVDLAGTAADTDAPGRIVRSPSDPYQVGQMVVPGLMSALCGYGASEVSAEVLAAAARALALTAPPGQALPKSGDDLVTRAIARQVGRVLTHPADR
ncbi:hypothetical protein [Prescottella agglutinans]|uniref:Uncharacterized protein n=1 Tax=Prescottella agglutinans TaxID=1644129 RepID=A0ABT6MHQ6_9NOCA|nr:hypothetical protein [Prescottella agglutinans]MDH6283765.1 hypothetical protein [Prescottella agglutinans]